MGGLTKIEQILKDEEIYFRGEESEVERLMTVDINRAKHLVYSLTNSASSVLMECHYPQPLIEEHFLRAKEIEARIDEIIKNRSSGEE